MRQLLQVAEVLRHDGIVQMIFCFNIGQHFRRQCALASKRATRREAHHKERDGNKNKQRRNRFQTAA
ncbi:hypothetical protein SEEE1392_00516 [Salmonella enterica subsp. enterica serovar Enteritidis str. 648901 39-2]|nr:hypothetical protein SEEE1392_00516 [Salmonella enterica subsp. enterica serovar Enteritidis str. 648901 39-2]